MFLMDYLGKPVTFEARGTHLMMHIPDLGTVDALALAATPECSPDIRKKIKRAAELYFSPAAGSAWMWKGRRAILSRVADTYTIRVCYDEQAAGWTEHEISRDEWIRAINRREIVETID